MVATLTEVAFRRVIVRRSDGGSGSSFWKSSISFAEFLLR